MGLWSRAKHDRPAAKPLPDDIRADLHALREVELPPGLELKLGLALRRPPPAPDAEAPAASSWLVTGLLLLSGALAVVVALLVGRPEFVVYEQDPQQIALALPGDGPGYVHLPWGLHDTSHGAGELHVDVPIALASYETDALSHEPHETSCDHDSCLHAFEVPHGRSDPLRVRIHEPGRYELNVRHVTAGRETRRRYVVVATAAEPSRELLLPHE